MIGRGSFLGDSDQSFGSGRSLYTEEIYEYQRFLNGTWNATGLLSYDGPSFCDPKTNQARPLEKVTLPSGWEWVSNWKLYRDSSTSDEGWTVASEFGPNYPGISNSDLNKYSFPNSTNQNPFADHVPIETGSLRRRKWRRQREMRSSKSNHVSSGDGAFSFKSSPQVTSSASVNLVTSSSNSLDHLTPLNRYNSFQSQVVTMLQSISSNTTKISNLAKDIGTSNDSIQLRESLKTLIESVKQSSQSVDSLFLKLEQTEKLLKSGGATNEKVPSSVQLRATRNKLSKDLNREKARFNTTSKTASDLIRKNRLNTAALNINKVTTTGIQSGTAVQEKLHDPAAKQMLVESELQVNEMIIAERAEALKGINKDLIAVKEVFQDLANIVNEQEEGIQQVATNVHKANERTKQGLNELKIADDYQQNGKCILQ